VSSRLWFQRRAQLTVAVSLALAFTLAVPLTGAANVALTQISSDSFTNGTSQHATEVEPDTFATGATIVSAFQVGRFFDGGASDIGFATSSDNGATWTPGSIPGLTTFASPAGSYDRVSDPSVAYDAKHNVWLISSLAIRNVAGGTNGAAVLVSRSTDGGLTWTNPVTVAEASGRADLDKNWTVCDTTATSPFYGNCYTEFDDFGDNDRIKMSTSTDGGLTWGAAKTTANRDTGLGGQPVVQPNGTVVVPFANAFETAILAFVSTDGGATWSKTVRVDRVTDHAVAGNLRSGPLPSAEIDGAGMVYVVWEDCRFRRACTANDIVLSTSTDGLTWSRVTRIPIDSTTSGVDHFIPGLAVDRSTSGTSARLGLTYYSYPDTKCTVATCQLRVRFVGSTDGGATWSAPVELAGPMTLSWLPDTSQGRMVGDYISTSFGSDGKAHGVFALAKPPTAGGNDCATATPHCDQAMDTPTGGLSATGTVAVTAADRKPLPNAASDHPAPQAAQRRR
jgi:BNR repeat protein